MVRTAVITKTFAPDFDLCASLNRSVLENSSDTIHHHIIAPRSDLKLFARLAGPRTKAAYSRSKPNICTSSGTGDRPIGAIRTSSTAYTGMSSLTNMNRRRINPSTQWVGAGLGISGSFIPWPWVNPTNGSLAISPTKARVDDGTYFCNSGLLS
jgi:hypothetical protein